jgi:PAS domain S-box-containing protein
VAAAAARRLVPPPAREPAGDALAWAPLSGRRRTAEPAREKLRFAFYGRVSTEDYQDLVTSRARQLGQAAALVAGYGQITAEYIDAGQSRVLPWARRPQAAALAAAMADPGRGFDAIVIGEYVRAFYGSQYALTGRPVESLVPVDLQAAHRGHRAAYAGAPVARPMGAGARLVALRKDGTTFPVEISLSPVATATGSFALTVIRDVTEARKLADLARAAVTAKQARLGQELLDSIPSLYNVGLSLQAASDLPATRPARPSPKPSGS